LAKKQKLDLAVIGNCRTAALLDPGGRIVWWCFPRFDSDPAFSRLLAGDEEKGFCDVTLEGAVSNSAAYVRNTAIVETTLVDGAGNAVRITDFAPRFKRFERVFNPPQLFRRIEPVAGLPRIRIRARPTFNYGQPYAGRASGSNHIRFSGGAETLRLTSDAPLSYIAQETPFALVKPVTLVLGPDEPFEAAIDTTSREFLERTRQYWLDWVRSLAVPLEYQADIIRAAITLKLCSFDETGAIIAAHTTSLPEAPGTPRTWDYRYCWLRDAFFVIKALNRLGATQTMETTSTTSPISRFEAGARCAGLQRRAGRAAGGAHRRGPRGVPGWARCASATRRPSSCSTMPTAA
jgi:GH15 family glucan-1,4-alpha-glucosidase